MSNSKYKIVGQKILLTKNDKWVATIDGDEVIPKLPVYHKKALKTELQALIEPKEENVSDIAEEQPTAEEVAEEIAQENEKPKESKNARILRVSFEENESWEDVAKEARKLFEGSGSMIKRGPIELEPLPKDKFNLTGLPKSDPLLGGRTPSVVEWWVKNYPEEAEIRYKGKGIEVYDNLTK